MRVKLERLVKRAVREGRAVLGYRKSMKLLKSGKPRLVIVASNAPRRVLEEIEHNCKVGGVQFKIFEGTSLQLGLLCGKPFPVMVMAVM